MGQESDPPVVLLVEQESMQADDDLHVLAHGADPLTDVLASQPVAEERSEVAAGAYHGLLLEHGKHPAQDHDRVDPVQAGAGGGKGAEVLHHLKPGQRSGRKPHAHHPAVPYRASIRDGDLPADRDHLGIFLNDPHQLLQRPLIEDGVGVEGDEVRCGRGVDPGIQGIGLAPVLLVDDYHLDDAGRQRHGRLVHRSHRRGADGGAIGDVGAAEPKGAR